MGETDAQAQAQARLRELAIKRIKTAEDSRNEARGSERSYERAHYAAGALSLLVPTLGAVLFFADDLPEALPWVVLIGGLLVALTAFVGARSFATVHRRRHACLGELAMKMENALATDKGPTREELDRFASDWRRCERGADGESSR